MIVEEIPGWRSFLALAPAWETLAADDPDGVLLGHDWTAECWKCCTELRNGSRPLVLGMRDSGLEQMLRPARPEGPYPRWRALVALRLERHARRVCFLEEWRSQRLDLTGISDGADLDSLWAAAGAYFRRRRDWDRLDLRLLREPSARAVLRQWPRLGRAARERGRVRQRRIRLHRPWPEVESSFGPYLRANFRRRRKRLEAMGQLRLQSVATTAGLEPILRECYELERQGWKGAAGTAIASQQARLRFYTQLAFRLASRQQFRLYCLRLNGRLIAFEYCILGRGRLYSLKISYDEALRTTSPGVVLRWLLLQAIHSELDAYEFLGDDAPWKADWTKDVTELVHVRAYNRTLAGQAWRARAGAYAWYRAARRMLHGPLAQAPVSSAA